MAVWALNVKMVDPLVAAAELSEENDPGKCSREVWGPSERYFLGVSSFDMIFMDFQGA